MTRAKKLSSNAICFIIAGAIILTFTGVKAFSGTVSNNIVSHGVINYTDGDNTVTIDSADFSTLATQVEAVKTKLGL